MNIESTKFSKRKNSMLNKDLFRFKLPLIKAKENQRKMSISIYNQLKNKATKRNSLSLHNENISNKVKNIYNISSKKNNRYSLNNKSLFLTKDHNILRKKKKSCMIVQPKKLFEGYSLDSSAIISSNINSNINSNLNSSFLLNVLYSVKIISSPSVD